MDHRSTQPKKLVIRSTSDRAKSSIETSAEGVEGETEGTPQYGRIGTLALSAERAPTQFAIRRFKLAVPLATTDANLPAQSYSIYEPHLALYPQLDCGYDIRTRGRWFRGSLRILGWLCQAPLEILQ